MANESVNLHIGESYPDPTRLSVSALVQRAMALGRRHCHHKVPCVFGCWKEQLAITDELMAMMREAIE